jgi:(2Fe-2S) ferredoxin
MDEKPVMKPYQRHVFFCNNRQYCDRAGLTKDLSRQLAQSLREWGKLDNPYRVKHTITDCLGVCEGGPLVVVYPEGIWYHHVDQILMARIVEEHLKQGCPVEEAVFHRWANLENSNSTQEE